MITKRPSKGLRGKMKTGYTLLLDLEQQIAYHTNSVFRGLSVTKKEEGWLIVLKVKDTKGVNRVSFTFAPTLESGFDLIAAAIHTTSVTLKWREDKFS